MVLRQAIIANTKRAKRETRLQEQHYFAPLKEESRKCLKTLAGYRANSRNPYTTRQYPLSRVAAVLVALFIGRWGDLYVLLSRRADDLKSYAGDTALPGGKREKGDRSPEDTARREALEEIGLPRDKRRIPLLCTLEPFLSTNNLIVFPVVVLVTDPAIKPILNTPEVSVLFSHPLRTLVVPPPSFPSLYHSQLSASDTSPEAPIPPPEQPPYHTFNDIKWGEPNTHVRIHKFLTGKEPNVKPLFGLTAAILLRVAIIGYASADVQPDFDVEAPDQRSMRERITWAMMNEPNLVEACKEEGISVKGGDSGTTPRNRGLPSRWASPLPVRSKL